MKVAILALVAMIALTGFSSSANVSAVKADENGIVKVTYITNDTSDLKSDLPALNKIATRKCRQAGYSYTEMNVQVTQKCLSTRSDGACPAWAIENSYQCAGNTVSYQERTDIAYPTPGLQP